MWHKNKAFACMKSGETIVLICEKDLQAGVVYDIISRTITVLNEYMKIEAVQFE